MMNIRAVGKTNLGRKRQVNEDSYLIEPDLGIYIIADGIGGESSGEVGSRMVIETMADYWGKVKKEESIAFLQKIDKDLSEKAKHLINSVYLTNTLMHEIQKRSDYKGMRSTMTAVIVDEDCLWVANVGDSLAYFYYDNHLVQITEEHSIDPGHRSLGMVIGNPSQEHILTQAIGAKERVEVFLIPVWPEKGDMILLCSNGLSNYASKRSMQAILDDFSLSLERKLDVLIDEAKREGSDDDISVILLEMKGVRYRTNL